MNPRTTGVVILATGAYFLMGVRLIKGFRQYFQGTGRIVFYFHSDNDPVPYLPSGCDICYVYASHGAWPSVAKSKYSCILADEAQMRADGIEQVCYIDADTDFHVPFGDDWFPPVEVFGAQHFCNHNPNYAYPTFETNPASVACLTVGSETAGLVYFYACFWGGQIDALLALSRVCKAMTDQDVANGVMAVWDDESYLNKYLHDYRYPDVVMLDRALPFKVSDKGGMEKNSRTLVFNLAEHHYALLACRDLPIQLVEGKVVVPAAAKAVYAEFAPNDPSQKMAWGASMAVLRVLCEANCTRDKALNAIADLQTDAHWQALLTVAIEHDVAPLLVSRLLHYVSDQLSPDLREGLDIYLEGERLKGIKAEDELRIWLEDLAAAGIEAMPYKGPRLARDLYGEPGLRSSLDLDVLLPLERIDEVLQGLYRRGFSFSHGYQQRQIIRDRNCKCEYILFHSEFMPVEPHWGVASPHQGFDLDYAALWQESRSGQFEGATCRLPSAEWELLLLCLHGGNHRWRRLKWVCDLAAFVDVYPNLNWGLLQELAARQGCGRMVRLGFLLAHRLLRMVLPSSLITAIHKDVLVHRLADDVIQYMEVGPLFRSHPFRVGFYTWWLRERWRERWRFVFHSIFKCPGLLPHRIGRLRVFGTGQYF